MSKYIYVWDSPVQSASDRSKLKKTKNNFRNSFHDDMLEGIFNHVRRNVGKQKMSSSTITDPSKVQVAGDGLHFGYINHDIEALIDTRGAGPGELTVYCEGPENNAYCELRDHRDGSFTLVIRAQDVGNHELHIKYENQPIPGSPFSLRVSPAGFVKVRGPGLDDGVLHNFQGEQGEFIVDTHEAGPGEIKFRVGGPRGAFKVKTRKLNRSLVCRYDPREAGVYLVHVFWSGDHVPGSPFRVYIAKDMADLERYRHRKQLTTHV